MDFNTLKESLKEHVSGATDFLSGMKEDGKEKFVAYINNIGEIIPIIAETGYRLQGIDLEISIPPGIDMHFEKIKSLSREAIDAILEKHKDRDMLKTIVNSLVAADEFHKKLKLGDLLFTDISISLGLPPKVTIKFVKKE